MNEPFPCPPNELIRIAVPVENGQLHGHFGGCSHFAFVEVDPAGKATLSTRVVPAPPHSPGFLPGWLHGKGVNAVIAGGIGRRALDLLARHGIKVSAGRAGAPLENLVTAYLDGQLTGTPEGCAGHGHHRGHGESHHDHVDDGDRHHHCSKDRE